MRPAGETQLQRILRRLAVNGARLTSNSGGECLVCASGRDHRPEQVATELVDVLLSRGLVARTGDGFVLSPAGASFLRRSMASGDAFRAQHQEREAATIVDDDGARRHVVVDRAESPLSWLRQRRGSDGRPMIDATEFAAGERLRSDYERGRIMPRVTANWSAAVAGKHRSGGAGGIAELTEAAIGARHRVERALDAVGPDLGGLLVDFCCFLKGLEDIERERRWPARSAKVVLRLALGTLARHYGLGPNARGRDRSRAILHWGTEDYRPVLE